MYPSTFTAALFAVGILAGPMLDTRSLPGGVAPSQHDHFEYHLVKARQRVTARGLAVTHAPTDDDDDTPAEDFIEMMDKEFGESLEQGPSDDWHPDDISSVPAEVSQPPAQPTPNSAAQPVSQPKEEPAPVAVAANVVHIVVTKTIQAPAVVTVVQDGTQAAREKAQQEKAKTDQANAEKAKLDKAGAEQAAREKAEQKKAKTEQAGREKAEQEKAKEAQQPAKTQEKPQSVKQEQPKTQEKPQPATKQPAAKPASGGKVSTEGLPTEFVPDLGCDTEIFKGLSKQHHDIHRTNHSLGGLAWNDTLYSFAKETAESCIYGHSLAPGGGGYGQNIAAGNAPGNISAVLTNGFYNGELELFLQAIGSWGNDQPDMSNFEKWGHLTQMLWKTTTSFACHTATCSPPGQDPIDCDGNGQSYLQNVGCGNGGTRAFNTVCNYYPPGNYAGEYSSVPPPEGIMALVEMTLDGLVGMS